MKTIRQNTFETNSSSTHSLCISKEPVKDEEFPAYLRFERGYFGRSSEILTSVQERASYIFTASSRSDKEKEYIEKLRNICFDYGVYPEFVVRIGDDNWDIDHSDNILPILDRLMTDEDLLVRFLFSPKSMIQLCGDLGEPEGFLRYSNDEYEVLVKDSD